MNKKALTAAFISILLFSAAAGTQFVYFSSANFFPEPTPPGIRINSDGSIEGTRQIQRIGNLYTLTGDIYNTIVVLRDDIVIDGAGYNLQGNGDSTGIFLQDRVNVTVKNMNIRNWKYGIKFTLGYGTPAAAVSSSIIGNTITNNTYGISLTWFSAGYVISGNRIANNTYGISFWSSNNVLKNNRFDGNEYSILDNTNDANDIDTSNTINGKSVYYWVNEYDKTVPSDAGFVVLKNCSGITVQNLNLANNGHGVLLYYTNGSTVSGNVLTSNLEGITLKESSGNVISGNRVANNRGCGVSLEYGSNNNVISQNEIVANSEDGVNFESSVSNTVIENYVAENDGNGIFFRSLQDSNVIGNNITLNKGCGIGFGYGPNGTISGNYISRNGLGIWISNAVENTITWNTIAENDGWGVRLEGAQKNNVIHHNNFINNNVTETLQASILGVWSYPGLNKPLRPGEQPEPPKFVAGAANVWDDGREGNYWSDYGTRYPNASEVGNTGVGDTPYFINENNLDRYPLMAPFGTSLPSQEPTSTQSPEPQPESLPTALAVAPIVSVAVVGVGLLVYFKKSKH